MVEKNKQDVDPIYYIDRQWIIAAGDMACSVGFASGEGVVISLDSVVIVDSRF